MKTYKYLLAIVFGLFGVLAQEPFHIWPLGILFVGFLFYCWHNYCSLNHKQYKYLFILTWVIYSAGVCNWISYFTIFAFGGFLALQAFFAFALISVSSRIYIKNYSVLFFAICFCVFEFALAHLPIFSFTWLSISTIPIDLVFLHNFVRSGGGALLVFVYVLFSASLANYIIQKNRIIKINYKSIFLYSISAFLIISFCLGFIGNDKNISNYKITVVQGNDKNRYLTDEEIDDKYLRNSHIDLAKEISSDPDLIIFPESSFNEDPNDLDNGLIDDLTPIAEKAKSLMIFNTNTSKGKNYFNTNLFYSPDMNYLASYSKKRLVPFGEYIPFKSLLGKWSILSEIGSGFSPGEKDVTIKGVTTLICFESTFSDDVRNSLKESTKVIVITTNNRSYRRSGNSEQHLAQSKLRAIEYSIPLVHASVSGKSALITKDGQIVSKSELFRNKLIEGSIDTSISRSFYAKTFDWFSYLCLVVVLCLLAKRTKDLKWKKTT